MSNKTLGFVKAEASSLYTGHSCVMTERIGHSDSATGVDILGVDV